MHADAHARVCLREQAGGRAHLHPGSLRARSRSRGVNHTGGRCRAHPAPLPAQARRRRPPGPAESAPTQHRRTSRPARCRAAGTGSCWLSRTGPGSPRRGREPSRPSAAIPTHPSGTGRRDLAGARGYPRSRAAGAGRPCPALPRSGRHGRARSARHDARKPLVSSSQLTPPRPTGPAAPNLLSRPRRAPGLGKQHTPRQGRGGHRQAAGSHRPPCAARPGGLGLALILPVQPCPSTARRGSSPAAARPRGPHSCCEPSVIQAHLRGTALLPPPTRTPPPRPLESAQASPQSWQGGLSVGPGTCGPGRAPARPPRCPCLHGDEGETKHKQGGQLLGHSQAARASPYCWGTSGGAAVTMCPRGR